MGRLDLKFRNMVHFFCGLILSAELIFSSHAHAGWGVGSEFAPYKKDGFDFSMSYPIEWNLQENTPSLGECPNYGCFQEVAIDNRSKFPKETSQVRAKFYQGLQLTYEDFLKSVPPRHPEIPASAWAVISQTGGYYPSITSGEQPGKLPNERVVQEYYFIGSGLVIQVESHSFEAGNGLYLVQRIRSSIDNSSKGPEVVDISWDKEKYFPGESACLSITVADTPGAVDADTLKSLELVGDTGAVFEKKIDFSVYSEQKTPGKTNFHSNCSQRSDANKDNTPARDKSKEKSRFQIEIKIQTYFEASDLHIRNLSFTNLTDGDTYCSLEPRKGSKEGLLYCFDGTGKFNGKDVKIDKSYPSVSWAEVSNSNRDTQSPRVTKLQIAEDHLLNIEATDKSGIAYILLKLENSDNNSILLFPDQIGNDRWIDLKDKGKWGRNNISSIVVVDNNKLYTTFKANLFGKYECKSFELKKDELSVYKRVPVMGGCEAEFPAISFSGGVRK